MKKAIKLMVVIALILVVFTGCAKKDADSIKIGGIFPLSGPVAVYGIEAKNGIELAIEEINAAGGINGKM